MELSVRPLTEQDMDAYGFYYRSLEGRARHYSGYLEGKDLEFSKTWKDFYHWLRGQNYVVLGLFGSGNCIFGESCLQVDMQNGKVFGAGIRVDGRKLIRSGFVRNEGEQVAAKFYEASEKYLVEIGFVGKVQVTVHPNNSFGSKRLAEGHGFKDTGQTDQHGYILLERDFLSNTVLSHGGPVRSEGNRGALLVAEFR